MLRQLLRREWTWPVSICLIKITTAIAGAIEMVKKLREELQLPVAVLIDTKGPEIRLGTFKEPRVELRSGELFVLTTETVEGDDRVASISFPGLPADVSRGSHILIDDGLIDLEVQKTTETEITCTVINGGFVSANKGVNVPGTSLSMPFMSDRDKADIAFACEMEADFICRLLHPPGGRRIADPPGAGGQR